MQQGMKGITIDDATKDQLTTFAATYLGMTLDKTMTKAAMIAKIKQAWANDQIFVHEEAPDEPIPQGAPPPKPANDNERGGMVAANDNQHITHQLRSLGGKDDPVVRIRLEPREDDDGGPGLFVSVNGRGMILPRGQEIDIPYRYVEVLRNAVETRHRPDADGTPIPRDVTAHPFQILSMPPQAEIDAWAERVKDKFAA